MLLIRTFAGIEYQVEVPDQLQNSAFAVRAPLIGGVPLGGGHDEPSDGPSPSYGRPLGRQLPTIDKHAVEVVALGAPEAEQKRIDELTQWLMSSVHLPLGAARARAVHLIAPNLPIQQATLPPLVSGVLLGEREMDSPPARPRRPSMGASASAAAASASATRSASESA